MLILPAMPISVGFGQDFLASETVRVSTALSAPTAKPGEQVVLAVVLDIADGFHIGNSAGQISKAELDKGYLPTELNLVSIDNSIPVEIGEADFPVSPQKGANDGSHLMGRAIVYIPLKIRLTGQKSVEFQLSLTWQACDDQNCFAPQTVKRRIRLPIAAADSVGQGCERPDLFERWSDRRSQKKSNKAQGIDYKSKEPPIGPPWVRDLAVAQKLALKTGRPIFLYSTKTFCPHCVVVESEMLSSPELKPYYDRAIWLYVYRDFKGGDADRQAERIGIRYSLSSWPQLWLIDPHTLSMIGEVGRSVNAFATATAKVDVEPTDNLNAIIPLAESEARVAEFESRPNRDSAIELLEADDVVTRILAARWFVERKEFAELTSRAENLLAVPNDALRYEVLNAVASTGKGDAASMISALVRSPAPSRNPNVLRSYAIKALGAIGDADDMEVIAPHAQGTARNMTTLTAVNAIVQIAGRNPASRTRAVSHLAKSFPPVEKGVERLVMSRARKVHQELQSLTGSQIEFPRVYEEGTRAKLVQEWAQVLQGDN